MPEPNRAFASYNTTVPPHPQKCDISHYTTAATPDADTVPVGNVMYDTDRDGPQWSDGTDWYYPSSGGGYDAVP